MVKLKPSTRKLIQARQQVRVRMLKHDTKTHGRVKTLRKTESNDLRRLRRQYGHAKVRRVKGAS